MSTDNRIPYIATKLATAYKNIGTLPVCVILHNIRSLYNVGAFFRTADAVGVERLCISGITGCPPHREISKTALGAENHVPWEQCEDVFTSIDTFRCRGYEVIAVETDLHAVDLFDWQPRFPVCLLFGHEADGLTADVLGRCDAYVRLPMRGLKHSLNVSTAGGVVLYELLRKYRQLHGEGL